MIRFSRSSLASSALAAFLQLVLLTGPFWEVSRAAPANPLQSSGLSASVGVLVELPENSPRHDESTCLACVTTSLVARLASALPAVRVGETRRIALILPAQPSLRPAGSSPLHSRAPPLIA